LLYAVATLLSMKALLPLFFLLFAFGTLRADDGPSLKAAEAAAIAQGDLDSRGISGSVYIAEMRYRGASLLGGEPAHWEVLWSKQFDSQTAGRKEIGVKVKMDGTLTRSVR